MAFKLNSFTVFRQRSFLHELKKCAGLLWSKCAKIPKTTSGRKLRIWKSLKIFVCRQCGFFSRILSKENRKNDIFATSFPTGSRMMKTAVVNYFKQNHAVEIRKTQYEFQKGGNKMLVIK